MKNTPNTLNDAKWGSLFNQLKISVGSARGLLQQALLHAVEAVSFHGNTRRVDDLFSYLETTGKTFPLSHLKEYVLAHCPSLTLTKGKWTCGGWEELSQSSSPSLFDAMDLTMYWDWNKEEKEKTTVGFAEINKRLSKIDLTFDKEGPGGSLVWDKAVLRRQNLLHAAFKRFQSDVAAIEETKVESLPLPLPSAANDNGAPATPTPSSVTLPALEEEEEGGGSTIVHTLAAIGEAA